MRDPLQTDTPRPPITIQPPKLSDPRLHIAAVITTVQILGQTVFNFDLSIAQILLTIGTCASLEITIGVVRTRILAWPASAMLTGNGIALVLRVPGTEHGDWWSTRGWWAFVGVAAFSLLSKYVIRSNGRHLFNPSNFGVVVCILVFRTIPYDPIQDAQIDLQDLWWGPTSIGLFLTLAVIALGTAFVVRRLRLLGIATACWIAFAAGTAMLASPEHCIIARWHFGPLCGGSFWWTLVTSPEVLIFLAFMITDPKTTPPGRMQRIVFGSFVGIVAAFLVAPHTTELRVKIGILGSLVIGNAVRPLIERTIPADARTLGQAFPHLASGGRRLVIAPALGVLGALVVVAGIPAQADNGILLAVGGERSVRISPEDVPPVTIDPSVEGFSPPIDETRADEIAFQLMNLLALEREAAARGDLATLATLCAGARFTAIETAINTGGPVSLPEYEFERFTIEVFPGGQLAPQLFVVGVGRVTSGGVARRVTERFWIEPISGQLLLMTPVPDLRAEST